MKETSVHNKSESYKNVFKSTFLFAFVQVVSIAIRVILNKVAAVTLGVSGMGVLSVIQAMSGLLKTVFGLGISQSAVRDISLAKSNANKDVPLISAMTIKVICYTAIMSVLGIILLAPYLSYWSFGDYSYTNTFAWLSVVVAMTVVSEGYLGILKGLRELNKLAKATIFGSLVGLIVGVPSYLILGDKGILPTLISVALSSLLFSFFFFKSLSIDKVSVSPKTTILECTSMIKMGVSLMFVGFLGLFSQTLIKLYVNHSSGLEAVGIYQAGLTILSGYFGFILVAMMTDYYPRISQEPENNRKISQELNQQCKVGLILILPLIVFFVFFMSFFVELLYSEKFVDSVNYMKYAIFWTILTVVSNPIDMILVAKQNTKVFVSISILYRALSIGLSILLFDSYGLEGLGVAMLVMAIVHIVLMQFIMYNKYNIKIEFNTYVMLLVTVVLTSASYIASNVEKPFISYSMGLMLILFSVIFSERNFRKVTNISVYSFVIKKIRGKKNA